MRVRIALAVGLTLTISLLFVELSQHPLVFVRGSVNSAKNIVTSTTAKVKVCQDGEVIPRGTTALGVLAEAGSLGSVVTVQILAGAQVIAKGTKDAGWHGVGVTVPITRVSSRTRGAAVCVTTGPSAEPMVIRGEETPATKGAISGGERLPARMEIEYLRPGGRSWWSLARSVARRMGLGHAFSGGWIVLAIAALMGLAAALTSGAILRELGRDQVGGVDPEARPRRLVRRLPVSARLCFVVAVLNAACWSAVLPLFATDDEQDHFAYVQQLAEAGSLPHLTASAAYSQEEGIALRDLRFLSIRDITAGHAISYKAEQQQLERDLNSKLDRRGSGEAANANSEPPLYYALETIPYLAGAGGTILLRMQLMRLLSSLMAGFTALFILLFLREALPRSPWVATVGGLSAALAPLLGSVSGSINPDAMLAAVAAAGFYCLARGFRRGLTLRLSLAIGAVTAIGLLTKLNFIGMAPGMMLGLLVLVMREARTSRSNALRWLALSGGIALSPVIGFLLVNLLSSRATIEVVSHGLQITSRRGSLVTEASYIWQCFLPRLPGMTTYFPGILPLRSEWLNGVVGLYGWDDVAFPDWVNRLALIPLFVLGALSVRGLIAARAFVRDRLAELTVYAVMGAGVLTLVGADAYLSFPETAMGYRSPRYLLPMLGLGCALLALAARGAGRRWGPVLGTLTVVLVLAHDLFSQLLVVTRFYG